MIGLLIPVVLIAYVVKQTFPYADGEFHVTFNHCSHKVEMVCDALGPGLYGCKALALAGSLQLLEARLVQCQDS